MRHVTTHVAPGPLRFKELNETISTLQTRNANLCMVNEQCKIALHTLYKNAICAVCLDVLHDPLLLLCSKQCMQNMCRGCFMKTDKRCPTCKEMTVTSISCGYTINSILGCVPRECDDCQCMVYPTEKHTTLQQCNTHRAVCTEVELDCCNKSHGCACSYKRKGRVKHLTESCVHVPCSNFIGWFDGRSFGCTFKGTERDVATHEEACKLEHDVHFLFTQLIKYKTNDAPPTQSATEPAPKCKNVEQIIYLLRTEHRVHY
jgi:hypothetical protein